MPTANIEVCGQKLPQPGVYATRICIDDKRYNSVTNIGTRPTVDDDECETVEACILDFQEDIYGQEVTLEGIWFLRPIQKFGSLQAVQEQVQKDIAQARKYF